MHLKLLEGLGQVPNFLKSRLALYPIWEEGEERRERVKKEKEERRGVEGGEGEERKEEKRGGEKRR